MGDNYELEIIDLKLLSSIYEIGFILITSKYSKENDILFIMDNKLINKDIFTKPIILLYHNCEDKALNKYKLSHIVYEKSLFVKYCNLFMNNKIRDNLLHKKFKLKDKTGGKSIGEVKELC